MSWLDDVTVGGGMAFPHGETVQRDRRALVPDPINPARSSFGPWDTAETIDIPGAYVDSASSSALSDGARVQVLNRKSLYCAPGTDIQVGDRIRAGGDIWYVNEVPAADTNPFTGWRPVMEIPLDNSLG